MADTVSIPQRVWRRTIAMLLVAMRYEIEVRYLSHSLLHDDEEFSQHLIIVLKRHKSIFDELTQNEKILMGYKIGDWPTRIYTQYSWHIEAVGCLLWALEQLEIPSHDTPFAFGCIDKYFESIAEGGISNWSKKLIELEFPLRNGTDIQYQLRRAELVYQRCIIASYIREGKRKISMTKYEKLFPYEKFSLPTGPSGDLVINKKEFCDMSYEEEGDIAPLSLIRVQTFRWVMDPSDGWDNLTVDYLEKLPK